MQGPTPVPLTFERGPDFCTRASTIRGLTSTARLNATPYKAKRWQGKKRRRTHTFIFCPDIFCPRHILPATCFCPRQEESNGGLVLSSTSGPSCGSERRANGNASGPIVIIKRQAASDIATTRIQLSLSLDLVHSSTPVSRKRSDTIMSLVYLRQQGQTSTR